MASNNPSFAQATAVSNYFYTSLYSAQIAAGCHSGLKPCVIYATGVVSSPPAGPLYINIKVVSHDTTSFSVKYAFSSAS